MPETRVCDYCGLTLPGDVYHERGDCELAIKVAEVTDLEAALEWMRNERNRWKEVAQRQGLRYSGLVEGLELLVKGKTRGN